MKKDWMQYSNKRKKKINWYINGGFLVAFKGKGCNYCIIPNLEHTICPVDSLSPFYFQWPHLQKWCLKFRLCKSRYILVGVGKPYSWGRGLLEGAEGVEDTLSDEYLGPYIRSMMKYVWGNTYRPLAVKCFRKKASSKILDRVLHTPLVCGVKQKRPI